MYKACKDQDIFEALFEHNPVQTIAVDRDGRVIAINKAKRDSGDRLPKIGDVMYRDYAAGHNIDMHHELMQCICDREAKEFSECIYDGKTLWISIAPFSGGAVIVSEDLTQSKKMADALKENQERLQAITDAAQDAIIMIDHKGNISFWNPAAERILGFSREEAIGRSLHHFIAPEEFHERYKKAFTRFQERGEGFAIGKTIDLQARCKDARIIDVQLSLSSINIEGNWHAVGILRDVTVQKVAERSLQESEERFRMLSITDPLTGLYNRWHFIFELKREIANTERYGQPVSAIMFDVDDFKLFNDAHGHEAGDKVLKIIGEIVQKSTRKNDIPCRIGGEEFFIILPMTTLEVARNIAFRISTVLKDADLNFDHSGITISSGVTQYDINEDIDAFVRRTDHLMMSAKKEGKDRIHL
jgi:diguanylate cyclase (GGDEF)-like protein/PAS domain S-box-containing protein